LLFVLALWAAWPADSARAASIDERAIHQFSIVSQSLENALQELAEQSGVQVIFYSGIALNGSMIRKVSFEFASSAVMAASIV
jgi:hypothetical protein